MRSGVAFEKVFEEFGRLWEKCLALTVYFCS